MPMTTRVPLDELLPILAMELRRHMLMLGTVFAIIALATLAIGISLPRWYRSSTTILVQESGVSAALTDGHAEGAASAVAHARELISSRKVMNEILAAGDGPEQHATLDQDRMIEAIASRIEIVTSPRERRVRIDYRDEDPARSLRITRRLAELFVREGLAARERESRTALDAIDSRVKAYRRKLTDAEDTLETYRKAAAGASPADDDNARISRLLGRIEQARIELMEQHAREGALVARLSDAAQPPATPPQQQPADAGAVAHEASYEALRDKLADAHRDSTAAAARLDEAEGLLKTELADNTGDSHAGNELAGLARDYEVNRSIYEDQLKRRENARTSMDLDARQQGLAFRIEQPAALPQHPSGLRLVHVTVAGLAFALLLPLGLLFGSARFDPRVRSAAQLERMTGLPTLATIPTYPTPADRRRAATHATVLALILAGVMLCYVVTFLLQLRASP
jgi:uncharacterized protein involved in exopolysaccharide biosynthesis